MMEQDMQEILFTREEVTARIRDLAAQITRDYQGKSPAVIGILRGSFIFLADLVRELNLPLTLDFMSASSYGSGTVSSGLVDIKLDTSEPITGRDVLLVEDSWYTHMSQESGQTRHDGFQVYIRFDFQN